MTEKKTFMDHLSNFLFHVDYNSIKETHHKRSILFFISLVILIISTILFLSSDNNSYLKITSGILWFLSFVTTFIPAMSIRDYYMNLYPERFEDDTFDDPLNYS